MKEAYIQYIHETNRKKSNKASSYIKAIDYLCPILAEHSKEFARCADIWSIESVEVISALYEYVIIQQKLFVEEKGIFKGQTPISYWRDRFCSAALKSYREFLVLQEYENRLWKIYDKLELSSEEAANRLSGMTIDTIELLAPEPDIDFTTKLGKEVLRTVKTRVNQGFFRKMILRSYNNQCCLTGLTVPEVLRASHIVPWAKDEKNRLNPANGLCLSATYDAAFDRHLLSLDDDYRVILSRDLKEYYTNEAFTDYFLKFEGRQIEMPSRFLPDQKFLQIHRKALGA